MKPGLFIAIGSLPVLGDHAPALLFLDGRFEELGLSMQKGRTDARLVISPWSDHLLEAFDPVLVNAAVDSACAAVHTSPPARLTAWRWRLFGAVLAILAARTLAVCLTKIFPRLARFRGVLVGGFVVAAFMLTFCGRWIDATPHWRMQAIAVPGVLVLVLIGWRLRIPRWSLAAIDLVVIVIALWWLNTGGGWAALVIAICAGPGACVDCGNSRGMAGGPAGFAGARGYRDGDLRGFHPVSMSAIAASAREVPQTHIAIKLNAKLLDACVGQYDFPLSNGVAPDSVPFVLGVKLTIWRQGDQLKGEFAVKDESFGAFEIHPESETVFFESKSPRPRRVQRARSSARPTAPIILSPAMSCRTCSSTTASRRAKPPLRQSRKELLAEWVDAFTDGPGIIVIRNAFPDHTAIDTSNAHYWAIIEEERASNVGGGDHFAKPGANDRIWNALEKLCLRDPAVFASYYGNAIIALVSEAWLGPSYQITSQLNVAIRAARLRSRTATIIWASSRQRRSSAFPPTSSVSRRC